MLDCVYVGGREDHLGVSPSWDGERTEPVVVARNWAVPACLIVLALGLPVLLAAEIARGGARVRGSPTSPRSRRRRAFWVVTLAAGGGLMAAFLDVGTDPESSPLWGVGNVPFDRPPGRWLRVPYSPGSTLLVDPPQVEWLRNKRRACAART